MRTDYRIIRVYHLGQGYRNNQNSQPFLGWPFMVDYTPDNKSGVFYLSEGDTHNGNGCFMNAARVLEPVWREHLETAGTSWLLPILERIVGGETVPEREILEAYAAVHGAEPKADEMTIYVG